MAIAEIDERAAESTLETTQALSLLRSYDKLDGEREVGPRGGVTEVRMTVLKAQREADPVVQELKQEVAARYAYRKLVGVMFTNVERDASLVSRELTRRTGSYEAKPRRENRWRA